MIELVAQHVLPSLEGWRDLGILGVFLFVLLFVLATLLCIPASALTATAGFLYGPIWGTLLVSPIGVVSAALAFLTARYIARPWVHQWIIKRPRFAAIDRAMVGHGFSIVFMLRLASIIPFAPLSYALGGTRVNGRDFVVASWLGLLPGTFLYVYLGSTVADLSELIAGGAPTSSYRNWINGFGLLALVIVLWRISHFSRQALKKLGEKKKVEQGVRLGAIKRREKKIATQILESATGNCGFN